MILLYKIIIILSWPYLVFYMHQRKRKNKEDISRFNERLGKPTKPRPEGKLLWMHGASVGETISMLPLIDYYLEQYPDLNIMVTSGTVTSAELMEKRLPKGAFHQYIPIDNPFYTNRFVKHWQPDAVFWFESDFWPSILSDINKNEIPLVLINGRISDKSFARWQRHPILINKILKMFTLFFGQSENDVNRLKKLGAQNVHFESNIKFAARQLPYVQQELEKLVSCINNRPMFLISSTHDNEEERFVPIFKNIQKEFPNLLMISSPRHPNRGQSIQNIFKKHGLNVSRRSQNEPLTDETEVYLADTLGEMGLLYKLCKIVFIGGSLIPHGGQNFLEPIQFNDIVIVGPHMHNFRLLMKKTEEYDAVIKTKNESEVEERLIQLLKYQDIQNGYQENTKKFMQNQNQILENIFDIIDKSIPLGNKNENT